MSVNDAVETRVIALNASTGAVISAVWLERSPGSVGEPFKVENHGLQPGSIPDSNLPWFENAGATTELRLDSSNRSNFKLSCTFFDFYSMHVLENRMYRYIHISIHFLFFLSKPGKETCIQLISNCAISIIFNFFFFFQRNQNKRNIVKLKLYN